MTGLAQSKQKRRQDDKVKESQNKKKEIQNSDSERSRPAGRPVWLYLSTQRHPGHTIAFTRRGHGLLGHY